MHIGPTHFSMHKSGVYGSSEENRDFVWFGKHSDNNRSERFLCIWWFIISDLPLISGMDRLSQLILVGNRVFFFYKTAFTFLLCVFTSCMWRSEDNLLKSVHFLHYVRPGVEFRVSGLITTSFTCWAIPERVIMRMTWWVKGKRKNTKRFGMWEDRSRGQFRGHWMWWLLQKSCGQHSYRIEIKGGMGQRGKWHWASLGIIIWGSLIQYQLGGL